MAIKNKLTEEFLEGLEEVKKDFLTLLFKPTLFDKMGLAYFAQYKRDKTIVEFIFGPSDWDVEMIIYTSKGKFAFKNLLEIPAIAKWVNDNRYKQVSGRNIKNELLWFMELLKISLPIIE